MPNLPEQATTLSAAEWRAIIGQAPLLFEVISNSMVPAFQRGDRVRIRPLLPGEPKPGQVLAYHRGMLVTHRYLGNGRCRGDNTRALDLDVLPEEMVGITCAVSKDGIEIPIRTHSTLRMALRQCRLLLGGIVKPHFRRG